MKKLGLFLVLISVTFVAALAYTPMPGDNPQFKVKVTGSDRAGFDVDYSWPGEDREPIECTVTVQVKYSANGKGGSEDFKMTHKVHNTGSGWGFFDGKSALDTVSLLDVSIVGSSCG